MLAAEARKTSSPETEEGFVGGLLVVLLTDWSCLPYCFWLVFFARLPPGFPTTRRVRCGNKDSIRRELEIHIVEMPPPEATETALRIAKAAQLDIGGIEYLVNARDGERYFYDVNALSNFVTDAPRIVGFDPFERFVDYLRSRIPQEALRN